jgi:hypothetical protein
MTINLNANPYWDDFDKTKGYKRILALPGRVEQSREFTQIQTIMQDQLTSLGNSIYKNGQVLSGCLLSINDAKTLAIVSVGSIYVDGDIIEFTSPTSLTITGTGTEIIGVIKTETIITEIEDPTLKDPAQGYDNYLEPGAHRLKITWTWQVLTDEGSGVFELINGVLPITVDPKPTTITENILDAIARRDFEKSGNYTLRGLEVSIANHPTDQLNKKQLIVQAGTARILGYNVSIVSNTLSDLELARELEVVESEPHTYKTYDTFYQIDGDNILGNRPVALVDRVVATELTVDGGGAFGGVVRASITRGSVPGGSDSLSRTSVVSIVAINQGGTWNPATESFSGGTTYASSTYALDGNRVSWAPVGAEPATGSSYSVAYLYRKALVKQIMEETVVSNESIVHGNSSENNILDHPFVCETNSYTGLTMYVNNPVGGSPPSGTPGVNFQTNYTRDTDFTVHTDSGYLDWYDHEVQILELVKGAANGSDALTGFTSGYSMGDIIGVAYYANHEDMEWNDSTLTFISPTTSYSLTTSYLFTRGTASISWSPGGAEPGVGNTYYVAVNARKYKTSNHPTLGNTYYVNYYYWSPVVNGDYLARDSFYSNWVSAGHASNVLQHYGLTNQDHVNFWRSYACNTYPYNADKPYPESLFEVNYRYYLPRYASIYLHSIDGVVIGYGASSGNPSDAVVTGDDKLVLLASIYCPADSLDLYLKKIGAKTFKVSDLHKIKSSVERSEENLARTWLDLDAKSIPITNKKGIMTTSFTDNERLDPGWIGSTYSIDPNWEELAMPHVDSFYSLFVDEDATTATIYANICSIPASGTETIEQGEYTDHESIAPYGVIDVFSGPSAYMMLSPSGDTLIIPRLVEFGTQEDADAWVTSDVFKLSNPSRWFSKGWSGETVKRDYGEYGIFDSESEYQTETFTANYIRDIQGNCRQINVNFTIPGGLVATSEAELDYFIYFGEVRVIPTLTGGTPPGSASGSFRPIVSTGGAQGTFMIPPNIPEGRIEVKVISSPVMINGAEWRQRVVAIFDASVVEQLTMQFTRCRCNCWCWCNCNCWACRGRCGTGPLAETLEPVGRMRVLKEVEIDFYQVSPLYGVYACLVTTDNGQPTSNTISSGMIARKYLSASQLAGAGMKKYVFDDPIFMKDECYAIVMTGEDGFNINSISEILAGRDIRCKIATLGKVSLLNGKIVGTQPFKNGILWRSLTGVTWEQDQKSDLKFKAAFNQYPTNQVHYIYMTDVLVSEATAFLCTWNSEMHDGTKINFEYKTPTGNWTEFLPYMLTYLDEVSDVLSFRVKLSTLAANISPFCTKFAGLYVQSQSTDLVAVTKNFEPGEPSDICDIYLDSHLPSGCTQDVKATFDNGSTWVDLDAPSNGSPAGNLVEYAAVDLNVINVKYRYHWKLTLSSPNVYSNVRVKIECTSTGGTAKLNDPRFSRLIVIASTA